MKYFIKRILIFSIPFILYIFLVIIIDPYNVFSEEQDPELIELKLKIPNLLNTPLYKLQEFSNAPTDIVLLGDSRTFNLDTKVFESLTEMSTTNLASGGGSLAEIVDTFWYTTKIHDIKQVYIGVNFNQFNGFNTRNTIPETIRLKNSPISYVFSQYCVKSTFMILKSKITADTTKIWKPVVNKAEFWKYQLESTTNNFYKAYKYPSADYKKLIEIAAYCKKKSIKLVFFIPPTHVDLQQKVKEFGLVTEEKKFKTDLENLGTFYDFDYPNQITKNKDNFEDPFHSNLSICDSMINEIVTGNVKYARKHAQ